MQKGWKVFSHLNGKSRKKLLACLLSISMIPVNGFTVMAATADQGNQAAVTQEGTTTPTVTSGISFAAESQNVTVGNFKYYEFQGTQAKDFDKVNFNISDQTALKIEQKTFKQADGTEVVKYMPIALKDSGKVTVTATFEKNKKPLDGVSAQFEFNLSKDDNIIPFTSQTMYQVFSGKEEGALTKADLAAKTEINLSDKGLTDTNFIIFLLDAVDEECFWQVWQEHPEYEDAMTDFTFYNNAMSGYAYTEHSLPLILSGEWFENKEPFIDYRNRIFKSSPFFNYLREQGYTLSNYDDEYKFEKGVMDGAFNNITYTKSSLWDRKDFALDVHRYGAGVMCRVCRRCVGYMLLRSYYVYAAVGLCGRFCD